MTELFACLVTRLVTKLARVQAIILGYHTIDAIRIADRLQTAFNEFRILHPQNFRTILRAKVGMLAKTNTTRNLISSGGIMWQLLAAMHNFFIITVTMLGTEAISAVSGPMWSTSWNIPFPLKCAVMCPLLGKARVLAAVIDYIVGGQICWWMRQHVCRSWSILLWTLLEDE